MKVNQKILSIPPYISTAWKNVASLHVESQNSLLILVVGLINGMRIDIPGLSPAVIKSVFTAHASAIEQESLFSQSMRGVPFNEGIFSLGLALSSNAGGIENPGSLLQHNPEQADGPDLPAELLQKISGLARTLGLKDPLIVAQPEPGCNCMHCQITAALHTGAAETQATNQEETEETISDEDLKFRTWDIFKTGDKLYSVSNPLDNQENYNVYLGDPVGCTCGNPHCEHIRAVLNS